jgi:hypothetical protein
VSGPTEPVVPVTGFYASTRVGARHELLLGPFTEKGIALTALDHARDLVYVTRPGLGPVPAVVEVTSVTAACQDQLPAGELNAIALALHQS